MDIQTARPVLRVTKAAVALGGKPILKGVNAAVNRGEIVVMLGPNGAGKSTLTRAICGQLKLNAGSVRIRGRDPFRSRRARQSIGLVPQQIALYEKLTPRENLSGFGAIMGAPTAEIPKRVEWLLEQVGLAERIDDPVRSLSGGMRRRINIAAALMHKPDLLVLDEPTVGLDYAAQAGIAQVLRNLRSQGVAVLLVTHDLAEAELLADTLAVLVGGRIGAWGKPADLIEHVFHDLREIKLIAPFGHRAPQQSDGAAFLEQSGLRPDERHIAWSGVLHGDDVRLARLLGALSSRSLTPDEVTIRRAGLEMLVQRCVAEAAAE